VLRFVGWETATDISKALWVFRNVVNYLPEDLDHQSFYPIPINFFVIWQRLEQASQDGFEYAAVRRNSDIA
jgi:hypothetical protein